MDVTRETVSWVASALRGRAYLYVRGAAQAQQWLVSLWRGMSLFTCMTRGQMNIYFARPVID